MLIFQFFLTAATLSAILLQARTRGRPLELVRFPMGLLRAGVGLSVTATALCWFFPSLWTGIAAALAQLPVVLWRNCRIAWGKRSFTISGVTGLKWTYTPAEVKRLCGPFLIVRRHVFLLYPGMENRDAFLAQLQEAMVVAARDAKYRRSTPPRQKENEASAKRINFAVLWSALLTVLFMFANQPITADTGRVYEVTLRSASRSGGDIHLDFGYQDHFEVSYTGQTAPLLETRLQGSDFTVQATHHSGRRTRDRYEIIALTGADGVVYRTWEESESLREDNIPETLLICLCLWTLPLLYRTEPASKGRKK